MGLLTQAKIDNFERDITDLGDIVTGGPTETVTVRGGRVSKTIAKTLADIENLPGMPTILTGTIDADPDPITVGTGDQFMTLAEAFKSVETKIFKGGFRQDIQINGTAVGNRGEYSVTSEDALSAPYKNGRMTNLIGTKYQTGKSRITIADIPRIFRDTPTGDFFTPTEAVTVNASGNTVIPTNTMAEIMTKVATGVAWAETELLDRRKTVLRCASQEGLLQMAASFGAVKNLAIINDGDAGNIAFNPGQRGVELDGGATVFFDGCWFHKWGTVITSAAGGGGHFGALNEFSGCGKVAQGQYNWEAIYSDFPANNAETGLAQTATQGSGNICMFGGNFARAKGDGGSLYLPNTFVTGMYDFPLSLDAVGYTNLKQLWTRDNVRASVFFDCHKVAALDSWFGETFAEWSVHMDDTYTMRTNVGTRIYGGNGPSGHDLKISGAARINGGLGSPVGGDGSGTTAPVDTRIFYDGYSADIANRRYGEYRLGRGNNQKMEIEKLNMFNAALNLDNQTPPDPVVNSWYEVVKNDGTDHRKYTCITVAGGWIRLV